MMSDGNSENSVAYSSGEVDGLSKVKGKELLEIGTSGKAAPGTRDEGQESSSSDSNHSLPTRVSEQNPDNTLPPPQDLTQESETGGNLPRALKQETDIPKPETSVEYIKSEKDRDDKPSAEMNVNDNLAEEHQIDEVSEGEDVNVLRESYRFGSGVESRKKLAPKRVKQFYQYLNITEDRIELLESRCDWLDKRLKKPGTEKELAEDDLREKEKSRILMKLNPQLWDDFYSEPDKSTQTHAIDILIGEPKYSDAGRNEPWRRNAQEALMKFLKFNELDGEEGLLKERSNVEKLSELNNAVESLRGNRLPDRIRFNSFALRHFLRLYFHSSSTSSSTAEVDLTWKIMLHPFKALTYFDSDIRALKEELFKILENLKSTGSSQLSQRISELREQEEGTIEEMNVARKNTQLPLSLDNKAWASILQTLDIYENEEKTDMVAAEWPTDDDAKNAFNCLVEFMDTYLEPIIPKIRGRDVDKIRFSDLWHLFRAGDEIITNDTMNRRNRLAMRVLRTNGGRRHIHHGEPNAFDSTPIPEAENRVKPVNNINPFCIHAYYLDFDGTSLIPVRRRIVIQPYIGERPIAELDVYPFEYASKGDPDIKSMLVERGRKFIKYATSSSVSYCDCKGEDMITKEELNDKLIVDMKEYYRNQPPPRYTEPDALDMSETSNCSRGSECTLGPACYHSSTEIIHDQDTDKTAMKQYVEKQPVFQDFEKSQRGSSNLNDNDVALCEYRLFAYKLRSRTWVQVHVNDLDDAALVDDQKGFERLVLPESHKHIIKSQVKEHFRKKRMHTASAQDDIDLVRGKGQGLIILLHGAPGVGKTCTAETIADLVRKPLYPITCGDLGSTAKDVEQNLKEHFTLASKWDCVMLLDEADVFLAKRKTEDLGRNSIVSVFLRIMEYYKGLLFLTTNRVGTFDEAFKSRVHISLFYQNFDEETTIKVWKTFITQTQESVKEKGWDHFEIKAKEIKRFAREHWRNNPDARWNGRQIRNAFHTAIAMAEFDAEGDLPGGEIGPHPPPPKITLGRAQFEKIASTVKDFDRYMTETMGVTYEQKAEKERWRNKAKVRDDREKKDSKKGKKLKQESSESDESEADSDQKEHTKKKKKKALNKSKSLVKDSDSELSSSDSD